MAIELQSVQSLFIEMFFNETRLSSGTSFLANAPAGPVLITNRHNVTGLRQDNNQPLSPTGGVPNKIRVWRNAKGNLAGWYSFDYPLYDDEDNKRWIEHPVLGSQADFVALMMDTPFNVENYLYDTSVPANELLIRPSEIVSVVGFPMGHAAGGLFAIWVSGFVASEPDVNYDDKPQFLIDCRSRPGQSGSPVIAVRNGTAHMKNGDMHMGAYFSELLGIYSGRISENSDIGIVWKRAAINELVQSIV